MAGRRGRRAAAWAAILLIAIGAGLSRAAPPPDESLTGVDMREVHRDRRARLAAHVRTGTLVLFSEPDDGVHLTRPEPNLRYLTGIAAAGCALVLRVDTAAGRTTLEERLYLPAANRLRERWIGPQLSPGERASAVTGIVDTRSSKVLFDDLDSERPPGGRLYLRRGHTPEAGWGGSIADLREAHPEVRISPLRPIMAELRAVKDAEEIARIRRACELTAAGLTACMKEARPGMREYELQARLEFICRAGGAPRQAFHSLVASGPNGTILHYGENRRKTEDHDLVLMDVGAEYMGYAADVTRTFPVNGRFTKEQAALYDAVLEAQTAALETVKPGSSLAVAHAAARRVLAAHDLEDAFLHSIGHHVGLDVHDPVRGSPLVAGMVITIEPGVYLTADEIGIRIEDTVLVTEDGYEVLSAGVPKTRAKIEELMAR